MEKRNDEATRFENVRSTGHADTVRHSNPASAGTGHGRFSGDGQPEFADGYYYATQEALSVIYQAARGYAEENDYEAARVCFDWTREIEERLARREASYGTTQENAEKTLDLFEHIALET